MPPSLLHTDPSHPSLFKFADAGAIPDPIYAEDYAERHSGRDTAIVIDNGTPEPGSHSARTILEWRLLSLPQAVPSVGWAGPGMNTHNWCSGTPSPEQEGKGLV